MRIFAISVLAVVLLLGCAHTSDEGWACKFKSIKDRMIYFDFLYHGRWCEMHVAVDDFKVEVRSDGKSFTTLTGSYDAPYDLEENGPSGQWNDATLLVPSSEDQETWERFLAKNTTRPTRVTPPKD